MSCTIDASASAGGLLPTAASPSIANATPQFAPTTLPTATAVAGANGGPVASLGGGGTAVAGAAAAIGTESIAPILQDLTAAIGRLSAAIQPLVAGGPPSVTGGGAGGCGMVSGGGDPGSGIAPDLGGAAGAPDAASGGGAAASPVVEESTSNDQSDPSPAPSRGSSSGSSPSHSPVSAAKPSAARASSPAVEVSGSVDAGKWLTGDTKGLDADLTKRLGMLGEQLGTKLKIVSGNRTFAEQTELYRRYKAGTGNLAARPGTSNHEHGDAADVNINGVSLAKNAKAKQLALKLGLHFPVRGEPWHVEVKK